ncbi:RNA polymerase sigma factor [Sphingomonas sp. FW199]|uniref:RNA polymerase sigma factor n=1 Tax=Sphingomonas sp. FW199 TaxID=3400217 RepID=UPI003CF70BD4
MPARRRLSGRPDHFILCRPAFWQPGPLGQASIKHAGPWRPGGRTGQGPANRAVPTAAQHEPPCAVASAALHAVRGAFLMPRSSRLKGLAVADGAHASRSSATDQGQSAQGTLEAAYRRERPALLRHFRYKASADEAEDLMQETFVRAAGSRQTGALANPAAFLRRIARNLLIDRHRRRARHPEWNDGPEIEIAVNADQEHQLEAQDLLRLYESAINSLSPRSREVFLLHRVEELSYRDIHARLGISVATVEYHMMKALAHIARSVDAAR